VERQSESEYKVRLTAAPVDNAANEQLVEVLAKQFGVPKRSIEIISGAQSRLKRIRITGS